MAKQEPRFINRELSWLEFNQRVLDEATDGSVPLLERLKFLAITASNLDEFFMVRVGGLQLLRHAGVRKPDAAGLSPVRQLAAIAERAHRMAEEQYTCYNRSLEPALVAQGVRRLAPDELNPSQLAALEQRFVSDVFPVVTPMVLDAARPFPLLGNLGLYLAVRLRKDGAEQFGVVPLGGGLERFVSLGAPGTFEYALIEDVVRLHVQRLFPGQRVLDAAPFRITRNGDMRVAEAFASDLLDAMEKVLQERKTSECVRLEIDADASKPLAAFLRGTLNVRPENVYRIAGPLALCDFMRLGALEGHARLAYEPWEPQPSPRIDPCRSMFETIRAGDVLLHHPFESFDPVVRFLDEAARDPDVLAIKQILYRTSSNSAIIAALQRAAENGKYVTVLVELKARFDEARNIEWARRLEEAGVQVIYGIKGLKTHAKICIVVRRETDGIRRYVHFGTGNYNEKTARLYTDTGYLTCRPDYGADASAFFNVICGYSAPLTYTRIVQAPINLRTALLS